MGTPILANCVGASVGALLRWALGLAFNPIFPTIPIGTVAANLIGGYLIGIALAFFGSHPSIASAWRLLVITGFLGGLTTFSTFSGEVVTLLQNAQFGWAFVAAGIHLLGSFALTALGMATFLILHAS